MKAKERKRKMQEAFDYVAAALVKQGGPAKDIGSDGHERCVYRARDGRKCGIGQLMPDDIYQPEFEGRGIAWLIENGSFPKLKPFIHFLAELQDAHDNAAWHGDADHKIWDLQDLYRRLAKVAKAHRLAVSGLRAAFADTGVEF